jgi:thioredoxin-related protein
MRKLAIMFLSIFVFLSACSNTEQPKEQTVSLLEQREGS